MSKSIRVSKLKTATVTENEKIKELKTVTATEN